MNTIENLKDLLKELDQLTQEIVSHLHVISEEEMLDFIDQREAIVQQMQSYRDAVTDQDRIDIQKILDCDLLIMNKLNSFKDQAGNWLEKQGSIRSQHTAYHQNYVTDSFFIDHLK